MMKAERLADMVSVFQRWFAHPLWHSARLYLAYSAAVLSVALVTGIIGAVLSFAPTRNLSILYLLAVLWLAVVFGRGPAILASLLAFFAYDFFFIPPLHRLNVDDPTEWISLFALLATSLVLGQLTAAVQARVHEALESQRQTATIYSLSELITSITDQDILLAALAGRVVEVFAPDGVLACSLILPNEGGLLAQAAAIGTVEQAGEKDVLLQAVRVEAREQRAQASWVLEHGTVVGGRVINPNVNKEDWTTPIFCYFLPLRNRTGTIGALSIAGPEKIRALLTLAIARPNAGPRAAASVEASSASGDEGSAAQAKLLQAFVEQIALALDRMALQRQTIHAEALSESDRLKDALLGSVTHDLRTPLAAIKAATDSLHDPHIVPTTRDELLESIDISVNRLNRLVGNILDLSRLEAGVAAPQMTWELIGDVVATVLDRMELARLLHDRTVQVSIPEDIPLVPMDHAQIEQVLTNVLENARKYSPTEAPIEVQARIISNNEHTDELEVRVSDKGIGIPPAELHAIFGKFYRVQRVTLPFANETLNGRAPAGTGLGLAIADAILRAHGGRIWAESLPGKGTTVIFRLPIPANRPTGELPPVDHSTADQSVTTLATQETGQPS